MLEKVLHIPDRMGIFPANDGQTISRRMGIEYRQRTLRQSMANVIQSPFVLVMSRTDEKPVDNALPIRTTGHHKLEISANHQQQVWRKRIL
jgi:hypothetical protein